MMNPNEVKSSHDLQVFIGQLIKDFHANNSEWENADLLHFLEAMGACIHDHEKTDRIKPISDNTNPWQAVAEALMMGKIYE